MKMVVLDGHTLNPAGDNPWTALEAQGDLVVYPRTAPEQVVERAATAQVLLTNKVPVRREAISALPNLRMISVLATGFNIVDVAAARAAGIPVANVPEYSTPSVAQTVFALLLSHLHRIESHDREIRAGRWQATGDFSFTLQPLMELAGLTMGIVGFGRIGRQVARLASAFGMNVLAYSPSLVGGKPSGNAIAVVDEMPVDEMPNARPCLLEELFQQSDVISLNCPQTQSNTEFVNAGLLQLVKPSAILINTARGGLIHEADLAAALNSGQIAAALLDVVSAEPISDANPLLTARNCMLNPHNAWATVAARKRMMQITADNISAFASGNPINLVN